MKVIVTGGAGFIGSHLVEKLSSIKKIKKITVIDNFKDGETSDDDFDDELPETNSDSQLN